MKPSVNNLEKPEAERGFLRPLRRYLFLYRSFLVHNLKNEMIYRANFIIAVLMDLFFMGVAFLLLETKSVVQFALLFGTTWLVNSLVFAGILLSVLLAVALSMKVRIRAPQRLYVVLIAFIALSFVVPSSALLGLPVAPRFLAAILLAFSPIFVANLVFAERFARVENATTAFGANLLGAMVGGTLEYLSLLTGYRVLLLVVAVIYGLAFFTGRRDLNVVRS